MIQRGVLHGKRAKIQLLLSTKYSFHRSMPYNTIKLNRGMNQKGNFIS